MDAASPTARAWLSQEQFTSAVDALPLVSIDLCITDPEGRLLLGLRRNTPAQGFWFTPGGRVRKNEPLAEALARVGREELGLAPEITSRATLMGAWDHFYPDSAFSDSVSTHYVNLPHWLQLAADEVASLVPPTDEQHSAWRWLSVVEEAEDLSVHSYPRLYTKWFAVRLGNR